MKLQTSEKFAILTKVKGEISFRFVIVLIIYFYLKWITFV